VITRAATSGISLEASTGGREVRGNLIGFNLAGTSPAPNGVGIHIDSSTGDSLYHNTIGNSTSHGILVTGGSAIPGDMRISYNDIGVTPAAVGAGAIAGNGSNGARFEAGAGINFDLNRVWYNGTDGVVVTSSARRIGIHSNSYLMNTFQAIDLSPDGVNPIDLDVGQIGANDQQNYPTLTSASGTASTGIVIGNLQSTNDTYTIRLYRNDVCDSNGYGEALHYVAQTAITIANAGPTSNGSATFSANLDVHPAANLLGEFITAIATDSQGNTSEVSACIPYSPGPLLFSNGFE
jgi:hypothetical protein